jgi:hypothetical protein
MDYQTIMKLYEILMTINLKVKEHIYIFLFLRDFYIYLEIIKVVKIIHFQWITL